MRCARAAAHDRSPAAPGTPGCALAGSSIREPALQQQIPHQPRVGPVGLGPLLAAARRRGVGRLGQMRLHPGPGQLRGHIPPPGARLERERHIGDAFEPFQPGPQMPPVGRGDLTAHHLPGRQVDIVEGDLLPVDIHPAYDRHQGPPHAPRPIGRHTPHGAPVLGRSPHQAGPPGQLSRPQTGRSMSSLPDTVTTGVWPRRAQVRAFGGAQVLPGFVLEADPRPGRRR